MTIQDQLNNKTNLVSHIIHRHPLRVAVMTSTRVFAVFALLLVAGSAIAANDPPAKDQCQTCKDLVNATRQVH